MLVLKRRSNQWTNIKLDREKLQKLLDSGQDAEIRVKVYNIVTDKGKPQFKMVFDDQDFYFNVERPERKKNQNQVSKGLL